MKTSRFLALLALTAGAQSPLPDCACPSAGAAAASREGIAFHQQRRLAEASAAYSKALSEAPPRDPSAGEIGLIRKFAPRLLTTRSEPFPLQDAAAILHPNLPWIAYHLFWEDDIDFPEDNDPCDHEVLWVELNPARDRALAIHAYYHGRLLRAEASAQPPLVFVQWGKHGSLTGNWRALVEDDMRRTWERLSSKGRDAQQSPLARGWPLKFPGSWDDFIRFDREEELLAMLDRKAMVKVSCLNNAVINRHFLRYNFAAKTEWPPALCSNKP